jgi:type III secretion system HrpB2-like protein
MTLPVPRISATDIMKRAATPEPDIQALTQRFEQLMSKEPGNSVTANPPTTVLPPQISNAIHSLDSANRMLNEDMYRMVIEAPHMDMQTITAINMELTLRTAMTQTQMTMCTAVAKSGKDGLSTLMKNQ